EEPFGWGKTIGGLARPMLRGVKKLDFKFTLTNAAYDNINMAEADQGNHPNDIRPAIQAIKIKRHVGQETSNRLSAIDGRTNRHCGYEVSQQKRKRVEEPFGWGKTIGGLARPMLRGVKKLDFKFTLTMAAYDLIKLAQVDRSNRLNDSRLPKQATAAHSKLGDNAKPGYDVTWVIFSAAC